MDIFNDTLDHPPAEPTFLCLFSLRRAGTLPRARTDKEDQAATLLHVRRLLQSLVSNTFHELVDENGPRPLHVVLGKVGLNLCGEVIQHQPSILGNGVLATLFNEADPRVEKGKVVPQQQLPELDAGPKRTGM